MSTAFTTLISADQLRTLLDSGDPELVIDAVDLARKMDLVDFKREELDQKNKANDDDQRLRLIELAKSVPITDLIAIASANGIISQAEPSK